MDIKKKVYNLALYFIIILAIALPSSIFYLYFFFNYGNDIIFGKVYLCSVYGYLLGAGLFEFIIKPCRNKTRGNINGNLNGNSDDTIVRPDRPSKILKHMN